MTTEARLSPVDYELRIGDSMKLRIQVFDEDDAIVAIDGAAITWKLAATRGGVAILSRAIGSGITIVDAPNGIYEVSITAANSATLTAGVFYWESRVTKGIDPRTVAIGYFKVLPVVT